MRNVDFILAERKVRVSRERRRVGLSKEEFIAQVLIPCEFLSVGFRIGDHARSCVGTKSVFGKCRSDSAHGSVCCGILQNDKPTCQVPLEILEVFLKLTELKGEEKTQKRTGFIHPLAHSGARMRDSNCNVELE
jgi:hypothetical protein